jgi:flagellar assembly factor FliW
MTTSTVIDSPRFGRLEVDEASLLIFPEGLIGVTGTRYALLARDEDSAFLWLQSVEDPEFALPVVNPWRFFGTYDVRISDADAARIGLDDDHADADVYVTVRAAGAIEDFTVNLRAPILVREGRGWQVINEAPDAPLRVPLLSGLAAESGTPGAA